jgi:transcriptional regulator with XRE-family HTH domain
MTLSDYLAEAGLTRAAFAARVRAHPITVSKWATGRTVPRPAQMHRIAQETGGAVQPADFYTSDLQRAS